MKYFILVHFDIHIGPNIFFSFPKKPSPAIEEIVVNLMDMNKGGDFFEYSTTENNIPLRIFNYHFTVPSKWARGGQEILMLSAVFDRKLDSSLIEFRLKSITDNFRNNPNIYKAFYFYSRKTDDSEISTYFELAQSFVFEGYKYFQKNIEEMDILQTHLLADPIDEKTTPLDFHRFLLDTFITTIDPSLPEGAYMIYDIGHRTASNLHSLFHGTTIEVLLDEIRDFYAKYELGSVNSVIFNEEKLEISVSCHFESCHLMFSRGQNVCKFTEGFLSGIFQWKISENVAFQETKCIANGEKTCDFRLYHLKKEIN